MRLDLSGTDLRGASLWKTHLEGASLYGAHLEGANLSGATGLTWEQLAQAILDDKTILPDYLKEHAPEASGPVGNSEE